MVLVAGLPVVAGAALWQRAGQPVHAAGLVVAVAAAVVVLPPLVMVVAAFPGVLPSLLVPRRTRRWWRGFGKSKPPGWLRWLGLRPGRRKKPPARMRRRILAADRGRCLWCGGRAGQLVEDPASGELVALRLELDHLVAFAAGGLNWVLNFFALCHVCNMVKSNYNVDSDGYVHYRAWGRKLNDRAAAARILAAERRARWNLFRLWRAAFAVLAPPGLLVAGCAVGGGG